jgi:cytosine/adenosine deaminase-related metal-dependent hydrolase
MSLSILDLADDRERLASGILRRRLRDEARDRIARLVAVKDDALDAALQHRGGVTHNADCIMAYHAFNHEESVRCFRKAAEHDRNSAMAYWGIAYASGSNYNKPWEAFGADEL